MRKLIVDLFSNRFGIVLATLNVCYFVSMKFYQNVFSHVHGESCFFFGEKFFFVPMVLSDTEDLMMILNLPAILFSGFHFSLSRKYLGEICAFSQIEIQFFFFSIFAVLQWLFIAWFARALAARIRKPKV